MESENARLKKLLVEQILENEVIKARQLRLGKRGRVSRLESVNPIPQ